MKGLWFVAFSGGFKVYGLHKRVQGLCSLVEGLGFMAFSRWFRVYCFQWRV